MHPSAAARLGIQCGFKDRAKNRGTDLRPVKLLACIVQKKINNRLRKVRNLNRIICKQAAVHIGKRGQRLLQIRIARGNFGVEHMEKVDQRTADIFGLKLLEIVVKFEAMAKDSGILGIETKNQPDTKDIQTVERLLIPGVEILL